MKFFTSDLHLNFCFNRPFKSPEHFSKRIIDGINQRCKESDTLYIVGDVINRGYLNDPKTGERYKGLDLPLEHYLSQIKAKVILITGNHCENNRVKPDCRFAFVDVGQHLMFASHYPTLNDETELFHWKEQRKWHEICKAASISCSAVICGHNHLAPKASWDTRLGLVNLNVSVDRNNWLPVSSTELIETYESFAKQPRK
jgi:calcineurin-like phosphoesterase family protein